MGLVFDGEFGGEAAGERAGEGGGAGVAAAGFAAGAIEFLIDRPGTAARCKMMPILERVRGKEFGAARAGNEKRNEEVGYVGVIHIR